jgi:tyrosinase
MVYKSPLVAFALLTSYLRFVVADTIAKKSNDQQYAITGLKTGIDSATGARPARTNIIDMQNDTPTW